MTGEALRRVRVVGNSDAGKTTLARRLGVAHLELDDVFWGRARRPKRRPPPAGLPPVPESGVK